MCRHRSAADRPFKVLCARWIGIFRMSAFRFGLLEMVQRSNEKKGSMRMED